MRVHKGIIWFDIETSQWAEKMKHPHTTGAIIQIAAIATDFDLKELESFEIKIQFKLAKADNEVLSLVGWSSDRWKDATHPAYAAEKFADFVNRYAFLERASKEGRMYNSAVLGGFNSSGFDIPVLKAWVRRLNEVQKRKNQKYIKFSGGYQPQIDVLQMAQIYYSKNQRWPNSFRLAHLCELEGIELENWHDAHSDVQATIELARFYDML